MVKVCDDLSLVADWVDGAPLPPLAEYLSVYEYAIPYTLMYTSPSLYTVGRSVTASMPLVQLVQLPEYTRM